jgi:type II secretory pathway pseudopilin PulG
MRLKCTQSSPLELKRSFHVPGGAWERAYTLAEVMVAMGVFGAMLVSLFAGFTSGYAVLRVARENLRATQILEEKMEVIRLVKWSDMTTPGFVPTSFTDYFTPSTSTNASVGLAYEGKVTLSAVPLTESYSSHLMMIQINLSWKSGSATRNRQMTTYVSEYGMQHYIY